ncbi:MAG: DNA recombination protein RmuC [Bacteroidetes bacterium]|jgi:DNA recombination protein RmuC|nr:DNA recombination protein RmuC [Bacteroidota bacterium]MBT4969908.1 DNA recombination protein RmuC [Bacteroidota bacterium]MBT5992065.1 DNA recombination protein RmuC [Bacteroidota bacterium]MBT7041313.1 DNA recombination protein RmuC [Bacteroidota bacterium]MBT7996860.1 DNA recombination protein RmuC [Bacteroidota bacterium]
MDIVLLIAIGIILLLNLYIIFKKDNTHQFDALTKDEFIKEYEKLVLRFDMLDKNLKDEFAHNRDESSKQSRENREELMNRLNEGYKFQKEKLDEFIQRLERSTSSNLEQLEKMRETIEKKITSLQEDNAKKLDQMREVVDEKLQSTLEKRLGESFKQVSERLELVHKGLGEMQTLATGVGDLKKVLSNVKTKGVLGEYQLENLLDQLLTPAQYEKNVKTKHGSNDSVEFAVKLPGREDKSKTIWLPLDAKFPTEDYESLLDAYESGDLAAIEASKKAMVAKIKLFAKDISTKYIDPPNTTDFAIMFLPFEGLYAEVLRNPGLFEQVQREFKIVITGPTTLSALLSSLQMGFRTLAIEKRSSEVWELLGAVKTEFGNFGEILEKTQKKLQEASNVIDQAGVRSRAIERKLRNVQELPSQKSTQLLSENENDDLEEDLFSKE